MRDMHDMPDMSDMPDMCDTPEMPDMPDGDFGLNDVFEGLQEQIDAINVDDILGNMQEGIEGINVDEILGNLNDIIGNIDLPDMPDIDMPSIEIDDYFDWLGGDSSENGTGPILDMDNPFWNIDLPWNSGNVQHTHINVPCQHKNPCRLNVGFLIQHRPQYADVKMLYPIVGLGH